MAAAIGQDGQVAWQHSFGFADLEARLAVADTTTFHLASLTKLFSTVVLLRLVDSGLVSLDEPVSAYGVTIPGSGTVRVRHLLSMTSSGATPGDRFLYDGDRFALLDAVIAGASGRSFADLATAWIIAPLGISRTAPNVENQAFAFSGLNSTAYRATMAKPYTIQNGKASRSNYPTSFSVSAGMISTAADVVRFAQALDAGTILAGPMRDLMFTPTVTSSGSTLPFAFGCFSQEYNGVRVIWSYGYWTAISALLIHVPELGVTFAVLADADRLSADYALGAGHLLDSPVAQEFLNAFVFHRTVALP